MRELPSDACPEGKAVALLTMHPRYISKSDFPFELLQAIGAEAIGSRSRVVKPDRWGIKKHPDEAITEQYFISAPREAFVRWTASLAGLNADSATASVIQEVEDFETVSGEHKLHSVPSVEEVLLEVVLHSFGAGNLVGAFGKYARRLGGEIIDEFRIEGRGLTFLPVRIAAQNVARLADFTFVRVARGMPQLRPYKPQMTRSTEGFSVSLPPLNAQGEGRAVIFDGGIPLAAQEALKTVVTVVDPDGIGPPIPELERHGLGVTSAFLFGSINQGEDIPPPVCAVDHVRVLGRNKAPRRDFMYLDVLRRIIDHLDANVGKYKFANISLGPDLPVEDNDVTAWTALLDEKFAGCVTYVTVAAGNSGERDGAAGLNRIQPPADGVNVLAVGSCDVAGETWERASYSSVGPGRTPGRVKPDGIDFGGSEYEAFNVLSGPKRAMGTAGTSFASPATLRTSAAVSLMLGKPLGLLALRALMIHRAVPHDIYGQEEVGWGRFDADPEQLITCEDDEALILYQGELPISQYLRCRLPLPDGPLVGDIAIGATLVISPEVDPNNASTYTRAGLEVVLRPHLEKFRKVKPGEKPPAEPKSQSFFSLTNLVGAGEAVLRDDAHKWEPCRRRFRNFRATSLKDPVLDVYYHHRANGAPIEGAKEIPYALVVSMKAKRMPDFYNRIARTFAKILVPLKPQVQVRIR